MSSRDRSALFSGLSKWRGFAWRGLGASATATVLLAAGCTSSGTTVAEPAQQSTPMLTSNVDPTRQPPAPPIKGARSGGVVSVYSADGLTTLDPTEAYYTNTSAILSGLVVRSLTQYVYDPDLDTMILIPDLATDLGTPNDDYTEWTYTIRGGVRFEDGTPVTADDVAYGIKRSFDRDAFPTGAAHSNVYFLHGDTYKGPYKSGTDYDGVVVDGDTITLTMAKPFPDMPYWGAFPAISPIPEESSNPKTYRLHPLATGPYKFAAYTPGKSLTLVRNPEWDPDTDPGRHNYPDEYRFDFTRDEIPKILADTGNAQTWLTSDNVPAAYAERATTQAADRLTTGPSSCIYYAAPDYRRVTELRVRQAIGYAFPYQEYAEAQGLIDGLTSHPLSTLLPPGVPGRRDYNPLTTPPGRTDPDKARAQLAEAGYEPGEYPLTFPYNSSDPAGVRQKNVLVDAFEAAGFDTDPYRTTSFEQLLAVRDDANGPLNLRLVGWCLDWLAGSSSLPYVLSASASNVTPNAIYTYFHEPAVDKEVQRIELLPLRDQPAAWGALDEQIQTDYLPIVSPFYQSQAMLHGSRIGGMNNDNLLGMPTFKDIYVRG